MRILLYEFVAGGGMLSSPDGAPPTGSLLREGAAMRNALAEDLLKLPDTGVVMLADCRLPDVDKPEGGEIVEISSAQQERDALRLQCQAADGTILIAPEFDRHLLDRVELVETCGGRLLSPDSRFVRVAANKQTTAERLAERGVACPRGESIRAGEQLPSGMNYPAVLKPVDGAGSVGIRRIDNADSILDPRSDGCFRLETFCAGIPVSVAVLCGAGDVIILPPSFQQISNDGSFAYLGGRVPLPKDLRVRAERLAESVVNALPPTTGYIGIDAVLGVDSTEDAVIEVNPRLTTSYCGLRRLARSNLAAAMLAVARGEEAELLFDSQPVEFSADGTVFQGDDDAVVGVGHRWGQSESC